MGSIYGGFIGAIVLGVLGTILAFDSHMNEAAPVLMYTAVAALIYGAVMWCVLIYKMWAAIQDGHARATPGQAVGFLFIPFYNLYWGFVAIAGFAKDYNAYVDRYEAQAPKLSEGLFLTIPILTCVGVIPFVNYLTGLVNLILMIIVVPQIINGVNALSSVEYEQEFMAPLELNEAHDPRNPYSPSFR
jgi:hypothetical protein